MLVPIGQAARMLGLKTSALRYYDEIGLVPAARRSGRRYYGRDALRRLALVQMLARVGVGLDAAGGILDAPREQWEERVRAHIERLEAEIATARAAQRLLAHLLECPAEHPAEQCPTMVGLLDRRLDGEAFESLAREEGLALPERRAKPGVPNSSSSKERSRPS